MPTFTGIAVDVETDSGMVQEYADVEFEVFCARCGAGLCNQSDTRQSRSRRWPQVVVEPCEKCQERAEQDREDEVRNDLDAVIKELRQEIAELNTPNAPEQARGTRRLPPVVGRGTP